MVGDHVTYKENNVCTTTVVIMVGDHVTYKENNVCTTTVVINVRQMPTIHVQTFVPTTYHSHVFSHTLLSNY